MKHIIIIIAIFINVNSLELIDTISNRAIENFFYKQIHKIHNINYYINNYILNHSKVPTKIDLVSTYSGISNVNWPKSFSSTSDVIFTVDFVNKEVRYDNIVSIASSNISKLFKYNVAHLNDTIINTHDSLPGFFNIIMPFDLEVMKFVNKVNRINNDGDPDTVIGEISTIPCNFIMSGKTLYVANGVGGFHLNYCNFPSTYRILPIFKLEEYISNISNYVPNMTSGAKVYSDINTTNVRIHIYDDNRTQRLLVR